jgi:hypothetical protein
MSRTQSQNQPGSSSELSPSSKTVVPTSEIAPEVVVPPVPEPAPSNYEIALKIIEEEGSWGVLNSLEDHLDKPYAKELYLEVARQYPDEALDNLSKFKEQDYYKEMLHESVRTASLGVLVTHRDAYQELPNAEALYLYALHHAPKEEPINVLLNPKAYETHPDFKGAIKTAFENAAPEEKGAFIVTLKAYADQDSPFANDADFERIKLEMVESLKEHRPDAFFTFSEDLKKEGLFDNNVEQIVRTAAESGNGAIDIFSNSKLLPNEPWVSELMPEIAKHSAESSPDRYLSEYKHSPSFEGKDELAKKAIGLLFEKGESESILTGDIPEHLITAEDKTKAAELVKENNPLLILEYYEKLADVPNRSELVRYAVDKMFESKRPETVLTYANALEDMPNKDEILMRAASQTLNTAPDSIIYNVSAIEHLASYKSIVNDAAKVASPSTVLGNANWFGENVENADMLIEQSARKIAANNPEELLNYSEELFDKSYFINDLAPGAVKSAIEGNPALVFENSHVVAKLEGGDQYFIDAAMNLPEEDQQKYLGISGITKPLSDSQRATILRNTQFPLEVIKDPNKSAKPSAIIEDPAYQTALKIDPTWTGIPDSEPNKQSDYRMVLARALHDHGLEPTEDNVFLVERELDLEHVRYQDVAVFENRNVVFAAHNEENNNNSGVDRFAPPKLIEAITAQSQNTEVIRATHRNPDAPEVVAKLTEAIENTKPPFTLALDGHGYKDQFFVSENTSATVDDFVEAFCRRNEKFPGREHALPNEQDIVVVGACYNADFINELTNRLHAEGITPPIFIGMSEKGQVAYSTLESDYGDKFYQDVLNFKAPGFRPTLGDVFTNQEQNPDSNISVFVPKQDASNGTIQISKRESDDKDDLESA